MPRIVHEEAISDSEEVELYDAAMVMTDSKKSVALQGVELQRRTEPGGFLKVTFEPMTWDHGVLHKDKGFMEGLKYHLRNCGIVTHTLDYNEENKQHRDHVLLVVDDTFTKSYTLTYEMDKYYNFMAGGEYLEN